jgi:hypothetical protein
VVPADPELADGAVVEPSELELFELEPLELELLVPESSDPDPELAEDDPAVEPDDALLVLVCVEPGSVKATTPATATPRIPVPAVTAWSLRRARARATTADTGRGSLLSIGTSLLGP